MDRSADEFLKVAFRPEASDGELRLVEVTASASGYAGAADFWTDRTTILEFAADLKRYPLDADRPARLLGGHGGSFDGTYAPFETVRVEASPDDRRGQVGLRAVLREDDRGHRGSRHATELVLLTTYERLRSFAGALQRLASGEIDEALIGGERLA